MRILASFISATSEFWIDWIRDELELISSNETITCDDANNPSSTSSNVDEEPLYRFLIQLCKRAVTAVPEVEVWLVYLRFLKVKRFRGGAHSFIATATIRRTCEHALKELGLHATEGPKLWSFYRHFEVHLLNNMLEQHGAEGFIPENHQHLHQPVVAISTISSNACPSPTPSTIESPSKQSLAYSEIAESTSQASISQQSVKSSIQTQSYHSPVISSSLSSSSSIRPSDLSSLSSLSQKPFRVVSHSVDVPPGVPSHDSQFAFPTPKSHLGSQLDSTSRIIHQVNRIRTLFCRQMTLPLVGLPDLFDEYR